MYVIGGDPEREFSGCFAVVARVLRVLRSERAVDFLLGESDEA